MPHDDVSLRILKSGRTSMNWRVELREASLKAKKDFLYYYNKQGEEWNT